jgi:hypothetical protein
MEETRPVVVKVFVNMANRDGDSVAAGAKVSGFGPG